MSRTIHASGIATDCLYRDHQYRTRAWLRPAWEPFLRGSFCHEARAWALNQYMTEGELPPLPDVLKAGQFGLETKIEQDLERGVLPPDAEQLDEAILEAQQITAADLDLVLPGIAPFVQAIEEPMTADLGDGYVLTGTKDLRAVDPVTGTATIPDLKTKNKSPNAQDVQRAETSLQLTAYALLHRAAYGSIPLHAIDYVWTMAEGPKPETAAKYGIATCKIQTGRKTFRIGCHRRITIHRTAADLRAGLLCIRTLIDADKAGFHYPAFLMSGIVSPCASCEHAGNEDHAQRCPFIPSGE